MQWFKYVRNKRYHHFHYNTQFMLQFRQTIRLFDICNDDYNFPGCPLACGLIAAYVCGTDGKTYKNKCDLESEACHTANTDLKVASQGMCKGITLFHPPIDLRSVYLLIAMNQLHNHTYQYHFLEQVQCMKDGETFCDMSQQDSHRLCCNGLRCRIFAPSRLPSRCVNDN